MAALAFVFTDGNTGKVKQTDRELIRSRCMQGKNKRQDSRRSLQTQRQTKRSSRQGQQKTDNQAVPVRVPTAPLTDLQVVSPQAQVDKIAASRHLSALVQHSSPHLDWEISRHTHHDTLMYPRELRSTSDILVYVKEITYPIYNFVHFEDKPTQSPLFWAIHDDLFRNAVQLMVSAFKERMRHQPLSTTTYKYYRDTMTLLKARLSHEKQDPLFDTTIWAINILASMAIWRSHHAEASTHTSALREITNIGGGESFLLLRPTLRYQIFSLELAISSATGKKPPSSLLDSPNQPQLTHAYQVQHFSQPTTYPILVSMSTLVDERVISVFRRLQAITIHINEHRNQDRFPDSSIFQASYEGIWTELLELKETLEDIWSESMRLALLAFLTITVFRVPNDRATRSSKSHLYPNLAKQLRTACRALEPPAPELKPLRLWLLTISAMSVFDIETEDWLSTQWKQATVDTLGVHKDWEHLREQLESVMWIGEVHDEPGKQAYAELMKGGGLRGSFSRARFR